ncbi:unannotated protein [freshwater metagenome]|uniref:Unannotated protein n=1 Tax=freshwater metagenome TaxID=449393 RepID=A0A6J5ZND2_9ZZZZ|nr:hypothetical protein [Actinomycetota bacterium]MSW26519.1 hypothetical protein [Actinomycetota bacterium]MSW33550.1 hypothetical protein [Actinomycetota bacterium]MSX30574.1 hypothetical protein [Actinomycetota bacterium]MSX51431.1 hypothetical protein [Actinomycetota bacterium]
MTTHTQLETMEDLAPRLKVGTLVLSQGERTVIGRIDHAIESNLPASVASALNGKITCRQVSQRAGITLDEMLRLVSQLDTANLLDTTSTKITVERFHSSHPSRSSHNNDDSNDGAYKQLQSRIAPELTFTTWFDNVKDGGVELIANRRNCDVTVIGRSRVATLLYGILLASGVSETNLQPLRGNATINDQDMCGGYLHASDIGLSLKTRAEELSREISLFPLPATHEKKENRSLQHIVVCVGAPDPDQLQKWMSDGTPHLLIEDPECASINIGPLVLPGKTPCWRCICLAREDQNNSWHDIALQRIAAGASEVPVSVAHHVAGLIALEILRFIDIGKSELIGNSVRMSYHTPLDLEHRLHARHPACGCNW